MEKDMLSAIRHKITTFGYGDSKFAIQCPDFVADLTAYTMLETGLNVNQSEVIVKNALMVCSGCDQNEVLTFVKDQAALFAKVYKAKVVRKIQVRTVTAEKDHRSCNSCHAQNYISKYDNVETVHVDRLYEVVVDHMCVCMCADCIEAMKEKLDVAMKGGDL